MTHLDWIRSIGPGIPGDRFGSLRHIDDVAKARATAAIRTGKTATLGRELVPGKSLRGPNSPSFDVEIFYTEEPVGTWAGPGVGTGTDHLRIDCHGVGTTHIDALNHTSVDHTWYGGVSVAEPNPSSTWEQRHGIFTRAIYIALADRRGEQWCSVEQPVTGTEIEEAIASAGLTLLAGDALALDMGRDNYETAGHSMAEPNRPGLGEDAAHWLSTQPVSVVCWDFLDVRNQIDAPASVHLLNWAQGLILVDNCTFADARAIMPGSVCETALVVLPLPMRRATGCAVNPMLIV